MKKIILMFTAVPMMVSAQLIKPYDSTDYFKNEVHFNVSHGLSVLMGGSGRQYNEVTYLRFLNEKIALRAGVYNYGAIINEWENTIDLSDSSVVKRENKSYLTSKWGLKLGVQKNMGQNRLKWHYGSDVGVYSHQHQYHLYENIYLKDDNNNTGYHYAPENSELLEEINHPIFGIAISPFIGLRYPISKHFLLSAQMGGDLMFSTGTQFTNNYRTGEKSHRQTNYFDFDSPGIISNVSLAYRF